MSGSQFLGEALAEYEEAVLYYETRRSGLGARFILEVDDALAAAEEFPEAGTMEPVRGRTDVRARRLASFPVRICYVIRDTAVMVVALFHARRRPGYWHARLAQID